MSDEPVEHVIEVANPIMGYARFFTLRLPDSWDLAPGVSRPEINASHERRAVRWVVNGDLWYVVYNRENGWAMELNVRVRPMSIRKSVRGTEPVSAGGHPAWVQWRVRRRGLPWKRHDVTFMRVAYECPQSERSIALELSGWCPEEGFRNVLKAMQDLRCH